MATTQKTPKKRIVFVCTGNTCRSPMAQYLMRRLLKKQGETGYTVSSCGLAARKDAPISPEAATVMAELGIRTASHKAKLWKKTFAKPGTLVVVMTQAHKRYLPYANVFSMAELTGMGDVADPFGGSVDSYRRTRDQLAAMCEVLYEHVIRQDQTADGQ